MMESISLAEWGEFDAKYAAPTFFARPAWASALAYAYPHLRPHPVRVDVGGTRVLVPLMQTSGGRLAWRELVGMPLGTYTCALRDDGTPASAREFEAAVAAIARTCDGLTLVPWPLGPVPAGFSTRRTTHETAVIDVSHGAEEALSGVAGVSRRMAGQAARRGVNCAPLRSALGITTYYGMLREAAERWGLMKPPFPQELLEGLVAYGGTDVEIWFAQCDNHPIAGGVIVYGSQELFFWSAAMRQTFAHLRPSNALNVTLIEAAAERKLHWYNLGASEGLPGVERFKRGLGAKNVPYAQLHYQSLRLNAYTRLRSSLRLNRAQPTPSQRGGGP
ncbi:MAG TPA: GNAT family N-acetyltransferase [Candidatus Baltobacteraceae bacterium]|nr:GNAT family N-acetyltransferase [Candidatus Baltobacteraceae bacterium]